MKSPGIRLLAYQVQTRNGSVWEHADTSDSLEDAQRACRQAARWGYAARVVRTVDGEVICGCN